MISSSQFRCKSVQIPGTNRYTLKAYEVTSNGTKKKKRKTKKEKRRIRKLFKKKAEQNEKQDQGLPHERLAWEDERFAKFRSLRSDGGHAAELSQSEVPESKKPKRNTDSESVRPSLGNGGHCAKPSAPGRR